MVTADSLHCCGISVTTENSMTQYLVTEKPTVGLTCYKQKAHNIWSQQEAHTAVVSLVTAESP